MEKLEWSSYRNQNTGILEGLYIIPKNCFKPSISIKIDNFERILYFFVSFHLEKYPEIFGCDCTYQKALYS